MSMENSIDGDFKQHNMTGDLSTAISETCALYWRPMIIIKIIIIIITAHS